MTTARTDLEHQMAASLSRHIGYTTGAYEIDRIARVATLFHNRPSLYQYEVVRYLVDQSKELPRSIDIAYATEIINYACALRILEKVADGPTLGTRRFSLTPEGFTIKSALTRRQDALLQFTLIGLVLDADCDMYGLLLDVLHETPISGAELQRVVIERFDSLREERHRWLQTAFPNRVLRDRMYEQISWNPRRKRSSSTAFGRHHVTPRLGWARWFGHIETEWPSSTKARGSPLTSRGVRLVGALRGEGSQYTWLGPEWGTQNGLGIAKPLQRKGPYAPAWNLLRPVQVRHSSAAIDRIANDVVEFMDTYYNDLKLVYANQASIASVMPYLHLKEYDRGYAVERDKVFDRVFKLRSSLSYLSSQRHKYGYFRRARR